MYCILYFSGFTLLRFYIITKFIKKKIDYGILFSPDSSDNDDVNNVAEIKIPYFTEHNSLEEGILLSSSFLMLTYL